MTQKKRTWLVNGARRERRGSWWDQEVGYCELAELTDHGSWRRVIRTWEALVFFGSLCREVFVSGS